MGTQSNMKESKSQIPCCRFEFKFSSLKQLNASSQKSEFIVRLFWFDGQKAHFESQKLPICVNNNACQNDQQNRSGGSKHFLSAESTSRLGSATSVANPTKGHTSILVDVACDQIGSFSIPINSKQMLNKAINQPIIVMIYEFVPKDKKQKE